MSNWVEQARSATVLEHLDLLTTVYSLRFGWQLGAGPPALIAALLG